MYDYEFGCSTPSEVMRQLYTGHLPSHTYANTSSMDRMHRLPARRYSISGMPSSSLADYCNLSENAANLLNQSANITNLLNETTKSLSRSSNILNLRYSQPPPPGYHLADQMSASTTLPPPPYSCSTNLPLSSNFCSYPNVNSQMPNFTSSNLANLSHCLSGYNRPSSDYLLSKPIYSNTYSNTSNYLSQPHSILSQTKNILSQHYASNPVLSRSLTNLPSSSSSYNHHFNNINHHYPVDYPPYLNEYGNKNYYKRHYSNYQTPPINKLDLDYSRASDFKRQVSFKFDVDELSIDS